VNAVNRYLGRPEDTRDVSRPGLVPLPTAESALNEIKTNPYFGGRPGGTSYVPQNKWEDRAMTGGEFALNAALPGGLFTKAANVLLPATATQAAKEAGLPPLMQAAAGWVGGAGAAKLGNVAGRMTAPSLPTAEQLTGTAQDTYRAINRAVVTVPVSSPARAALNVDIRNTLKAANEKRANLGGLYAELDKLPAQADVGDLLNLRKGLKNLSGEERAVATRYVIPQIESAIDNAAGPAVMRAQRVADANYNAGSVMNSLDKRMNKAELQAAGANSGLNLGNKLRQAATAAATNARETRYMQQPEIDALEAMARGTRTQNALRYAANSIGGGHLFGGLAGFETARELGENPWVGGLGGLMAGRGLRQAYARSAANQARQVSDLVAARSPMAIHMGAHYVPRQTVAGSIAGGALRGPLFARRRHRGSIPSTCASLARIPSGSERSNPTGRRRKFPNIAGPAECRPSLLAWSIAAAA
jgi:hypothetical protein